MLITESLILGRLYKGELQKRYCIIVRSEVYSYLDNTFTKSYFNVGRAGREVGRETTGGS